MVQNSRIPQHANFAKQRSHIAHTIWFYEPARTRSRVRPLASQTNGIRIAEISNAAAIRPAGVARAVAVIDMESPM
jgi:hypothetical protein